MKTISWIGTCSSILGAFLVAMTFALAGYSAFILGSITWLTIGVLKKDVALSVLNGFFLMANIIGIYNAV